MSLHTRIQEARKSKGLTQSELGQKMGVAKTTVSGWEKNREPTAAQLGAIVDVLDVDVEFLLQDEIKQRRENTATPAEMEHIKKYRALDEHGKDIVDTILEMELSRVRIPDNIARLPSRKPIPLFGNSFAAGWGEPDFGNFWEEYEVPADSPAEFAIRINGDSMEPYIRDGSIALCRKTAPQDGDVGAFLIDGELICKKVCIDFAGTLHLFSLNRARRSMDRHYKHDDIERQVICFGTVILDRQIPLPLDV